MCKYKYASKYEHDFGTFGVHFMQIETTKESVWGAQKVFASKRDKRVSKDTQNEVLQTADQVKYKPSPQTQLNTYRAPSDTPTIPFILVPLQRYTVKSVDLITV